MMPSMKFRSNRERTIMSDSRVQDHYGSSGIAAQILAALRVAHGPDASISPAVLAPVDHFHGRGLDATRDLAALLAPQAGEQILDIGCGIGGPARWIAAEYNCAVTGVDLTPDFCVAARELTAVCGLADRVRIVEGNALALPLPDGMFDRAYSQYALMNVADKAQAFREAFRVLKPHGRLVLTHLNAGPDGPPAFPQPWASVAEHSFLATDAETRRDLEAAGFEILDFRDTTETARAAGQALRKKIEAEGLPAFGFGLLLGERARQLQLNTLTALEEERIRPVEVVAHKAS
jgi:ubiquinone/menaquinone biosynthesis C-methylase UbiE